MFSPRIDEFLDVTVLTVGSQSATAQGKTGVIRVNSLSIKSGNVSALSRFKVLIRDLSEDSSVMAGQALTIRIVSVAYVEGLPEIIGVCCDSVSAIEENTQVRITIA